MNETLIQNATVTGTTITSQIFKIVGELSTFVQSNLEKFNINYPSFFPTLLTLFIAMSLIFIALKFINFSSRFLSVVVKIILILLGISIILGMIYSFMQ